MELLSRKIGQHPFIDFIARNTFVIMQTHLLFANIPQFYMYIMTLLGSDRYAAFDIQHFINSPWAKYPDQTTQLVGFFCGLLGSLLVAYLLEKIKPPLPQLLHKKK